MGRETRSRGRAKVTETRSRGRASTAARLAHALGVTTPQRAAMLAVVLCALVLTVAVPLRGYLAMEGRLESLRAEEARLEDKVAALERRLELLRSRAYTEVQARERLRYVYPGRTPFIVQLPGSAPGTGTSTRPDTEPAEPWYSRLWSSLTGARR